MSAHKCVLLLATVFIVGIIPHVTRAGTTGKIVGTARQASGETLPGAAITVQGTRLGATTDASGNYIILLVPPGSHTVVARLIGFRPTSVTRVRVSADQTSEVDFRLSESDIEIATEIIRARRPVIDMDVTASQIIIDAERMREAPVSQMLDYLSYEPGVSITRDNELEIRGGSASEIRFQVDGLDRTDALTSKGYTQLNQTLVSEVTVLTGGFNAEYGNLRSGLVNAVTKTGAERGFGVPWVSAVYSHSPAARKHFGASAYDSSRYDFALRLGEQGLSEVFWPDFYREQLESEMTVSGNQTVYDSLSTLVAAAPITYRIFNGWDKVASGLVRRGAYIWTNDPDKRRNEWEGVEVQKAWKFETNYDERLWQYGHEADWAVDMSIGQALPNNYGGLVIGYSRNKEMTPFPTLREDFVDQTVESKLTLTPTDRLKVQISYMFGTTRSTGAAGFGQGNVSPDLQAAGGGRVQGSDPRALRDAGSLIGSINGVGPSAHNNKFNLGVNAFLDGDITGMGSEVTYTLGPTRFLSVGISRFESIWDQYRDIPRVNVNDDGPRYGPTSGWSYKAWLFSSFTWVDEQDVIISSNRVNDWVPSSPDELDDPKFTALQWRGRNPLSIPYAYPYDEIPREGKFIYMDMILKSGDSARVVSPQGYMESEYSDLSGSYGLGQGGYNVLDATSNRTTIRADYTDVIGRNTFKIGVEYSDSHIDYEFIESRPITQLNTFFRQYTADPTVLGLYFQDKLESGGMIANIGFRVERFNNGGDIYSPDNLFDPMFGVGGSTQFAVDPVTGEPETDVASVFENTPHRRSRSYWRFSPRFGISHPVSERTKIYFNYGRFYNSPKADVTYGLGVENRRWGHSSAAVRSAGYADLRPPSTTMYEVGVERAFPADVVVTVRGFAKYNIDQPAGIDIQAARGYWTNRNNNWEDLRGLDFKLARSTGLIYGWATYSYLARRSGNVGIVQLHRNVLLNKTYTAESNNSDSPDNFQALIGARTPMPWGSLKGGWSANVVQTWREGGEVIYDPLSAFTRRDEIPEANILHTMDYWNTDLKLSKRFALPGGRAMSVYLDVNNLFNTKRLTRSSLGGPQNQSYTDYVFRRRLAATSAKTKKDAGVTLSARETLALKDVDLRLGDSSTWAALTSPYEVVPGNWKKPIAPTNDWLLFLSPRAYRFGITINL